MTLRHRAYEAFTRHLVEGQLAPGQFVTQKELAKLTGFGLSAIREMIPRLEAEGLIRAIPQRGLHVAQLDVHLLRDAFGLREVIELHALAHFVTAAPDGLVHEQSAALDAVRRRAEDGITDELLAEAQRVDWGFHDTLVDFLGNPLMSDIHRVNAIRIRMMRPDRVTLSATTLPPAMAEHVAIVRAIERRDIGAATNSLRGHLASARKRALGIEAESAEAAPVMPARKI